MLHVVYTHECLPQSRVINSHSVRSLIKDVYCILVCALAGEFRRPAAEEQDPILIKPTSSKFGTKCYNLGLAHGSHTSKRGRYVGGKDEKFASQDLRASRMALCALYKVWIACV